MSDIQQLVTPGEPGWRVAVVTACYPDGAASLQVLPLIGWGQIDDPEFGVYWLPCWWSDLGVSTGSPSEIAWALGPGETLAEDHAEYMKKEITESYRRRIALAKEEM